MLAFLLFFVLTCNGQLFLKNENTSWVVLENSTTPEFTIVQDISGCPDAGAFLYFDTATSLFHNATCGVMIGESLASYTANGVNVVTDATPSDYINETSSCRFFFGEAGQCAGPQGAALITCTYGCAVEHSNCSANVNSYDIVNCCTDGCPALPVSSSTCVIPATEDIGIATLPFIDICGSVVLTWFGGCGDGVGSGTEECDGTEHCEFDCTCSGVGVTGNTSTHLCQYCGDDIVQFHLGEQCENSTDPINCNPATCACIQGTGNASGICEYCGDSIYQPHLGEQCDNPSITCISCNCAPLYSPDGAGNCALICGNGVLDIGEECDPGISATCLPDCTCPLDSTPNGVGGCDICGDGIVSGTEYCDDRHCSSDCTKCEGTATKDVDTNMCRLCGNSVVDAGEACDTGLDLNCDVDCLGCRNNRVSNAAGSCILCGNNVLDSGETCDDPGCNADCTGCQAGFVISNAVCTTCGNGKIDNGEACDTALAPSGGASNCKADCSGCEANHVRGLNSFCTLCGNGAVDAGEACDGRGCKADCTGCYASFTLEGTTCVAKEDNSVDPNDNSRPSKIVSSASVLSFVPFSLLGLYYFFRI